MNIIDVACNTSLWHVLPFAG